MSMSTRSSRLHAWPGMTRSSPWIKLLKTMHGSWDGRWPLPSRSEWIAHERAGVPWPSGSSEVNAVQTERKEYKWHEMNDSYRESFGIAAADGWRVWVYKFRCRSFFLPKEAKEICQRLKPRGEGHKILTPRYVFTDKARWTSHLNQQPWIGSRSQSVCARLSVTSQHMPCERTLLRVRG